MSLTVQSEWRPHRVFCVLPTPHVFAESGQSTGDQCPLYFVCCQLTRTDAAAPACDVQVISKDLVHWQRLPPPIQSFPGDHDVWGATGERTFDGSISMLPAEDGGPIFLYDAPDKIPKGYPGCGECILSIARLNKTDDKYLQLFTRDEGGGDPVNLTGQNMTKGASNGPVDFPSTIWKNGAPTPSPTLHKARRDNKNMTVVDSTVLWARLYRRPLEFHRAGWSLHDQGQIIPAVDARGTRFRRLP